MKKGVLLILIINLFHQIEVEGQVNLVPNGSFEVFSSCPSTTAQIYLATGWSQASTGGTSDYFNTCSNPNAVGVPMNTFGHQLARTGLAYAGLGTFSGSNQREYIQTRLDSVLLVNHTYCLEFYLSLADTFLFACNSVGAYFSDTLVLGHGAALLNFIPQVSNINNPLTNKTGWVKVSGSFVALGGEKFIIVGNFLNDAFSDTLNVAGGIDNEAYYYIDDISVIDCTGIGITETTEENISIYPNPATDEIIISPPTALKVAAIKVYNVLGKCMLHQQPTTNNQQLTINISGFAKGVYFVEVQTEKGIIRKKLVKE